MTLPAAVSPLEAHLGYWLRFVSNHVSNGFAHKLAARGVSVAEWVVMRELYDQDAAPSDLAERIGMTRGAITKLADRLIGKALIVRTASAEDGRRQTLALAPKGRTLVPRLAALADKNDAEFFDYLTAAERERLIATMQAIVRRRGLTAVPTD